jgi:hypothetical protein
MDKFNIYGGYKENEDEGGGDNYDSDAGEGRKNDSDYEGSGDEEGGGGEEMKISYNQMGHVSEEDMCGFSKDIQKKNLSGIDRIKYDIGKITWKLNENELFIKKFQGKIDTKTKNELCEKVDKFPNAEKMNAVGYILGYIATSGGTVMDRKIIEKILNSLDMYKNIIEDDYIKPPDLIRYSRIWMKYGSL